MLWYVNFYLENVATDFKETCDAYFENTEKYLENSPKYLETKQHTFKWLMGQRENWKKKTLLRYNFAYHKIHAFEKSFNCGKIHIS